MRDIDVRKATLDHLRTSHAHDVSARIVQEMGIWSGTVRIDIAVINGELNGVELKSDKDTLERLPAQAELYSRVFDRMTLVAGTKHIDKAISLIPHWWGVMAASDEAGVTTLSEVRAAAENPAKDAFLMAKLLWKEEAIAALESFGLARGWRSKPVDQIHGRLAECLSLESLGDAVRSALKARPLWLGQSIANM